MSPDSTGSIPGTSNLPRRKRLEDIGIKQEVIDRLKGYDLTESFWDRRALIGAGGHGDVIRGELAPGVLECTQIAAKRIPCVKAEEKKEESYLLIGTKKCAS